MKTKISIIYTFIILIFLFANYFLLPTHDDWGTFSPNNFNWDRMFSGKPYWRPFDTLFGFILKLNPHLFPQLNHVFIILGHIVSSVFLGLLLFNLNIKRYLAFFCVLLFLFSPGMLGTVIGIDSLNQVYSTMWGIAATYYFISLKDKKRYFIWIFLTTISVLCKESGIVWFIVAPLLELSTKINNVNSLFKYENIKIFCLNLLPGILLCVIYIIFRLYLINKHQYQHIIDKDSIYYLTIKSFFINIISVISGSYTSIDFITILHKPSRNLFLFGFTLLLNIPLLYYIIKFVFQYKEKGYLIIFILINISIAAPHIITHVGPMHIHPSLIGSALLIAVVFNEQIHKYRKKILIAFGCFFLSCIITDIHHWYKTYISSQVGIKMAEEIKQKTNNIPNDVLVVTIEDSYPRYSSFCVPPRDAYKGSFAVDYVYNYAYKFNKTYLIINEKDLPYVKDSIQKELAQNQYDCVWINYKNKVSVINLK